MQVKILRIEDTCLDKERFVHVLVAISDSPAAGQHYLTVWRDRIESDVQAESIRLESKHIKLQQEKAHWQSLIGRIFKW